MTTESESWELEDHIRGTIYGHCVGDTIGLLTEFMNKNTAKEAYKDHEHLEYEHKLNDSHRVRWQQGDWTDDSDQMILIIQHLIDKEGQVDPVDYGERLLHWARRGFPELGDHAGMGIGATTSQVLKHQLYKTNPHKAAEDIWQKTGSVVAPNGAVMRTSILGVHEYENTERCINNSVALCKTTHADPRCVASCVAMVTAISLMLKRQPKHWKKGAYDLKVIIEDSYQLAKPFLQGKHYKKYKKELKKAMFVESLKTLDLDEKNSIGYTYKALGAGFWALKQSDFRTAMEALTFEGGDADTNGAVAGALLGCKLGAHKLPATWRDRLLHKEWLDTYITRFLDLQSGLKVKDGDTTKP